MNLTLVTLTVIMFMLKQSTQIHLDTAPTSGEKVRVYTFANHDPLQIERQNYKVKTFTTVTVGTDDYVEYRIN